MKPVTCTEVDRNLWRYVDRELSAADLAHVSAHLRSCEACQRKYHGRSLEASQYRAAFLEAPFGEKFVARFVGRMKREGMLLERVTPQEEGLFLDRRRWLRAAALAALVLLIPAMAFMAFLSMQGQGVNLGEFTARGGSVMVGRVDAAGHKLLQSEEAVSGALSPAQVVSVPGDTMVTFRLRTPRKGEESFLWVTGPAEFSLRHDATRDKFAAFLQEGTLVANVASRAPSESFQIDTPHATARVVGTEFRLEVTGEMTQLQVIAGKVAFEAKEFSKEDVAPEDGPWVVRAGAKRPEPLSEKGEVGVPPEGAADPLTQSGEGPTSASPPPSTGAVRPGSPGTTQGAGTLDQPRISPADKGSLDGVQDGRRPQKEDGEEREESSEE